MREPPAKVCCMACAFQGFTIPGTSKVCYSHFHKLLDAQFMDDPLVVATSKLNVIDNDAVSVEASVHEDLLQEPSQRNNRFQLRPVQIYHPVGYQFKTEKYQLPVPQF
jgi:hypothetical protein